MKTKYWSLLTLAILFIGFIACEKDIYDTKDVVCESPHINSNHSTNPLEVPKKITLPQKKQNE